MSGMPLDVILDVANELDLPDSVHLVSTCSTYRSLVSSRNFWIKALYRIKYVRRQILPCSSAVDISTLPLATLQEMAQHAHKLDKKWSQETISPVSVRTLAVGTDLRHIYAIPGTDFILTTNWRHELSCLDSHSGECLASIDFPHARSSFLVGRCPFELPGQCLIAFACKHRSEDTVELSAMRLDFRNREHVTLHKEFSKLWDSSHNFFWGVTISDHGIAGVLGGYTDVTLVYYSFKDDRLDSLPLNSHVTSSARACILHQGSLYVTHQDSAGLAEIQRFETRDPSSAATGDALGFAGMETVMVAIVREGSGSEPSVSLGGSNMRFPTYGVLNVTTRSSTEEGLDAESHYVHFWPVDTSTSSLEEGVAPIVPYRHPYLIDGICVGSAGTSAVIWDTHDTATLVRYIAHPTPHTTAHRLDLSALGLDFRRVPTFELDDRLGVIYVLGREAIDEDLYILSYT
ncbi:hypothetical protein FB451DRAFT_1554041 [Mycena latifolia]|nr:hypothetical protein FB451DRAFT_1554041 [Mycena latifolia]